MNQSSQTNTQQNNNYHESMLNYIMDSAPYQHELKKDTLPFVTSFGARVYNQTKLVDIESDLKGQNILANRCDNHVNSKLGQ